MTIPYASSIDMMLNEIQNARVQNLAAAPAHAPGRIFFNTATGLFGFSDGTSWKYVEVGALDIEAVQDAVAAMVAASTVVTATYNDTTGAITLSIGAGQVTNAMLATGISADKISAGSTNGVVTLAQVTKLNGIATGATANDTDANLKARANHTGTQSADTLTDGTTNKAFLATERTKLTGIATAATANSSDATLLARANHTGTQSADTVIDGTTNKVLTAANATKLAALDTDANLKARANHTGTQSADTIVDGTTNKVLSAANASKLAGIATGATANATDANLRDRATHTGSQSADTLTDGTTNKAFLATERTKLAGIATAATANAADATLLARANHTGTQAAATISDFNAAVDSRIASLTTGAPAAMDTLDELAAALGDDPNFAATITALINARAKTYSVDVGDGSTTSIVVTHNLNTRDVLVALRMTSAPYTEVAIENEATTVNTLTLRFASAPATAAYRVTVAGR